MKVRIVKQYGCDFCNKKSLSASHISKHQLHCTVNKNRICRMCNFLGNKQPNIQDLIKILPNPRWYKTLTIRVEKLLPELRKKTKGCPVCMFAALRQARIPLGSISSFNLKEECSKIFEEKREQERKNEEWVAIYG